MLNIDTNLNHLDTKQCICPEITQVCCYGLDVGKVVDTTFKVWPPKENSEECCIHVLVFNFLSFLLILFLHFLFKFLFKKQEKSYWNILP